MSIVRCGASCAASRHTVGAGQRDDLTYGQQLTGDVARAGQAHQPRTDRCRTERRGQGGQQGSRAGRDAEPCGPLGRPAQQVRMVFAVEHEDPGIARQRARAGSARRCLPGEHDLVVGAGAHEAPHLGPGLLVDVGGQSRGPAAAAVHRGVRRQHAVHRVPHCRGRASGNRGCLGLRTPGSYGGTHAPAHPAPTKVLIASTAPGASRVTTRATPPVTTTPSAYPAIAVRERSRPLSASNILRPSDRRRRRR